MTTLESRIPDDLYIQLQDRVVNAALRRREKLVDWVIDDLKKALILGLIIQVLIPIPQ